MLSRTITLILFDFIWNVMINEDKNNPEEHNIKSAQYENTPQKVIYNAARFNRQFLDSQLGGNLLL